MKKILFTMTFIFSLWLGGELQASHLMGGQITGKQLSNLQYEIVLTLYRDSMGIQIGNPETLAYFDNVGASVASHQVYHDPGVLLGNGVDMFVFRDTITFPAPGDYMVHYGNCCRNASILNISSPASTGMALEMAIQVGNNNSPDFINHPIPLAQVNVPYVYNPLPVDMDGDSLAWSLDIPSNYISAGNTTPAAGYAHPFADPSDPFTMDIQTGEISFTPNTIGNFVAAVVCNEYRNGVLIGHIRREMQIIVLNSSNSPAAPAFMANMGGSSNNSFTIPNGQSLQFDFDVTDTDGHGQSVTAMGEPFLLTNNPAVFSATNGIGAASLNVTWTPSLAQARSLPYLMNIRRTEHLPQFNFGTDMTFRLFVDPNPTSITENDLSSVSIFPNPSSDLLMVSYQSNGKTGMTLELIETASGKIVLSRNIAAVNGTNISSLDMTQLAQGSYLVKIGNDQSGYQNHQIQIVR
jgi:hypothetical protein